MKKKLSDALLSDALLSDALLSDESWNKCFYFEVKSRSFPKARIVSSPLIVAATWL
jgi:hypothetical protein